jgi:alpha-1,2-mannosyltransferase
LLVVLPIAVTAFEFAIVLGNHTLGLDFKGVYWLAGHRVLAGHSPYTLPMLLALKYPAPAALFFAPFSLLPNATAGWLFAILVFAALPSTLYLMGVRDWRVYAIALLWQPVLVGWETANISLLLTLGTAAAWHWRDRPVVAGLLVAVLASVKIFLFPLIFWLAVTRRWRACVWAVAGAIVMNALAWAVLGVQQIPNYLQLLHRFQPGAERRGYSLIGLAIHLGLSQSVSYALGLAAAACVVLLAARSPTSRRDTTMLTACIVSSLLASPLVESHYLTLLLVPLAILRPRLAPIWALPVILLVTPADHPSSWQHALGLAIGLLVPALALAGRWAAPGAGAIGLRRAQASA